MLIQRGVTAVSGTTATVTLDTSVKVGESFVVHSQTSGQNRSIDSTIQCYLDTVVSGNYTEIKFERNGSDGTNTVYWEVISGEEFSVQSGETTVSGASTNVSISSVDTTKTLPLVSWRTSETGATGLSLSPDVTSSTNLNLKKSESSGNLITRWQVVESDLFNVKKYTGSRGGTSTTVSVDEFDATKSFVYGTWKNDQADRRRQYTWFQLKGNDEVEITTERSVNASFYEYVFYIVELTQGRVIRGEKTDVNDVDISSSNIDPDKSIMMTHAFGNFAGNRGEVGHEIADKDTLKFYLVTPYHWVGFGYQLVEFADETPQNTGNFLAFM